MKIGQKQAELRGKLKLGEMGGEAGGGGSCGYQRRGTRSTSFDTGRASIRLSPPIDLNLNGRAVLQRIFVQICAVLP